MGPVINNQSSELSMSSPCSHQLDKVFHQTKRQIKRVPRALCNCHARKGGYCLSRCTLPCSRPAPCRCGCQSGARYCGVGVDYWAYGVMNSKSRGLCYSFVVEITKLEHQATCFRRGNIECETVECTLSGQIFMHKHEATINLCSNLLNAFWGKGQSTKSDVMACTSLHSVNTPMTAMLITVIHIESCPLESSVEGVFGVQYLSRSL